MKIYLVGGAVRDELLGLPVKERDFVVVGAKPEELLRLGYKQVGKEFPVFLHPKTAEEYALARKERKVAPGYTGFDFDSSPEVTLEEDLSRRDLTINAMARNLEDGKIEDPYGGQKDLEKKLLRHVSPAFVEDPVRILRVARFAARFAERGFHVAEETQTLMKEMVTSGEVDALVAERVWKELERALSEKSPQVFFEVLSACGALAVLFPMLSLTNPGLAALKEAAALNLPTPVRFAALTHRLSKDELSWLSKRYRLPVECRDLGLLVAKHYQEALGFAALSPEQQLALFTATDVFRREERFEQFLQACQVLANLEKTQDSFVKDLKDAQQALKAIPIDKNLSGAEIGKKLQADRLSALQQRKKS